MLVEDIISDSSESSLVDKVGGFHFNVETQTVGHFWSRKKKLNLVK